MITKNELQELLQSTETYRVERTNSTSVTQGDSQEDSLDDWIEAQIKKNPIITTEELGQISGQKKKNNG